MGSDMMPWPRGCLALIALGVALLAFPQRLEGPPLLQVGEGHAISTIHLIGVLPLVAGSVWLHFGLWTRRTRLLEWVRATPSRGIAVFACAGFGLGLLLASAMSYFFWWWAVGAVLFVLMHVPVLRAASSRNALKTRTGAGQE